MEKVIIKGDLIIHGNLIPGDNGQLLAKGFVSWGYKDGKDVDFSAFHGTHILGNYDISDKIVRVTGDVKIWGGIDESGKGSWVVTAGYEENHEKDNV